jgi:glycerol-3-phosphate acyltransferase PlsY
MSIMALIGATLLGYLSGSVPYAVIAVRLVGGPDVRTVGSRNPGAANTFRQVGPAPGLLVAVADILKGMLPVLFAAHVLGLGALGGALAGVGAVLGHQFSILLRFRGGDGLATAIGVIGGLLPGPFLLVAPLGLALAAVTRNIGWSGGISIALLYALGAVFLWAGAPAFLPDALIVREPAALYGAFSAGLLLLIRFWTRRAGGLRARRAAFSEPADAATWPKAGRRR